MTLTRASYAQLRTHVTKLETLRDKLAREHARHQQKTAAFLNEIKEETDSASSELRFLETGITIISDTQPSEPTVPATLPDYLFVYAVFKTDDGYLLVIRSPHLLDTKALCVVFKADDALTTFDIELAYESRQRDLKILLKNKTSVPFAALNALMDSPEFFYKLQSIGRGVISLDIKASALTGKFREFSEPWRQWNYIARRLDN